MRCPVTMVVRNQSCNRLVALACSASKCGYFACAAKLLFRVVVSQMAKMSAAGSLAARSLHLNYSASVNHCRSVHIMTCQHVFLKDSAALLLVPAVASRRLHPQELVVREILAILLSNRSAQDLKPKARKGAPFRTMKTPKTATVRAPPSTEPSC